MIVFYKTKYLLKQINTNEILLFSFDGTVLNKIYHIKNKNIVMETD